MGYDKIIGRNTTLAQRTLNRTKITDFRKDVMDPSSIASSTYSNDNVNIATRVGIGNPGSRPEIDRIDLNKAYEEGQDRVNMKEVLQNRKSSAFNKAEGTRDLIKFGFETIINDSQNSSLINATHFRAYLTGYSDSHEAEWSAKRYSGRGENFYTYQGANRSVNFNFKVAAQSKQEMVPLYRKLNYLVSTLYPDYSSAGSMRGNITKLTLGELFYRQPGILNSLNITVADEYPWEIAFKENVTAGTNSLVNADPDMIELPQIIDVAVSFTPILNVLPQTGYDLNSKNNKNTPILIASESDKAQLFLGNKIIKKQVG